MKKFKLVFVILGLLLGNFGFALESRAAGASLYIAPNTGTYVIGSTFTVSVKVSTGGQVVNAAEGSISFDTGILEAVSVSRGGAIFNLWTTEPTISGGAVRFGGGIPMPGYNGSGGHVCTITFKAKAAGTGLVRFTSGAVLANDGKGTNILSSMGSGSYTVSPKEESPKSTPKDDSNQKKQEEVKIERIYNKPEISSETHPDQDAWYKSKDVKFDWDFPSSVVGVSVDFNENSVSDPGPKSDGLFKEKEYSVEESGTWYLHLKFKDSKKWGTVANYRVNVDDLPPENLELSLIETEVGDFPELHFKATDKDSGIDKYQIFVDNFEKLFKGIGPDQDRVKLSGLDAGKHTALVKAIDKAGNEAVGTLEFEIATIPTPVIKNYSREIKSGKQLFINGTATPEVKVNIYIGDKSALISSTTVDSDTNGNWFYSGEIDLSDGRYTAWVDAVNKNGIISKPSAKVGFIVSPPVFAIVGDFIINYFTVLVSLIFLIILIIVLILFIIGFIRRKLKKETIEIEEVLRRNISEYEKTTDKEFDKLSKLASKVAVRKEIDKSRKGLKDEIRKHEKKILKEVQDVENILK